MPLPCTADTALLFISFMDLEGLSPGTIRVYLAAVRSLHIEEGYPYTLDASLRLRRALRAITIKGSQHTQKMPITFDILQRLHSVLPLTYDGVVLRAAMDLAFFGCLRASEFCASSTNPTGSDYICLRDVGFASSQGIDYLRIRIKSSKTDTTRVGFTVCIGCTGSIVCGHCSVLLLAKAARSLSAPRTTSSPLFQLASGAALTKPYFISRVRSALSSIGIDATRYSGHSFRAGAATTGALVGMTDYELQLLGRWSSDAYRRYIRAPIPLLIGMSGRLAQSSAPGNKPRSSYRFFSPPQDLTYD